MIQVKRRKSCEVTESLENEQSLRSAFVEGETMERDVDWKTGLQLHVLTHYTLYFVDMITQCFRLSGPNLEAY